MVVNGKTLVYGLIGHPVEHTLSPLIHHLLAEKMGINMTYLPFPTESGSVEAAVRGAFALGIRGLNVTVPHKSAVQSCLTHIDRAAAEIGAVNTLIREENGYRGLNTDMEGLYRALQSEGIQVKDAEVLLLGAGGAARAAAFMCAYHGAASLTILNRSPEKAARLAAEVNQSVARHLTDGNGTNYDNPNSNGINRNDTKSNDTNSNDANSNTSNCAAPNSNDTNDNNPNSNFAVGMTLSDYETLPHRKYLVLQSTSVGLSPDTEKAVITEPAFYQRIHTGYDMIYNPAQTHFMKLVQAAGGTAYNGLKMLLYQAILAFEQWHQVTVPEDLAGQIYRHLAASLTRQNNIILIGFMGSGKSTIGRCLADRLQKKFTDTDSLIEQKEGRPISKIFAAQGEPYFRQLETECLKDLLAELPEQEAGQIIAVGGGLPMQEANQFLLYRLGKIIYLKATIPEILARLRDDHTRPLLQAENPGDRAEALLSARHPVYGSIADHVIDTTARPPEEIAAAIIALT